MPLTRAINSLRTSGKQPDRLAADPALDGMAIVRRYFRNKCLVDAVSAAYGVVPIYVWQPSPGYKYDTSHHVFIADPNYSDVTTVVYPLMKKAIAEESTGVSNSLWLADIQEHAKEPLYLDTFHYTSRFCSEVARQMGWLILERGLGIKTKVD